MTTTSFARPPTVYSSVLTCVLVAAALRVTLLLSEFGRVDSTLLYDDWVSYLIHKGDELLRALLGVPVIALTLQAIERLPLAGARRMAGVAVLSLTCALISAGLMAALPYAPLIIRYGGAASTEAWFWYTLWANLVTVALAAVALNHLRERRHAVERLAAAQDAGRAVRQQLAHAQLQAIQARVDPQLLFNMLAAVKRFYDQSAERAERLLDELTAFLRAALPRLRSARSSLEAEFQLVASYARLQQLAFDRPISYTVSLPAELSAAEFPAGVLQPLAVRVLEKITGEVRIELAAEANESTLTVSVVANISPDGAAREQLSVALADLYGDRAHCRWASASSPTGGARSMIELEVPREYR